VAFGVVRLETVREAGRRHQATINDVLLAAATLAIGRALRRRGERPGVVKVLVPVNVRSGDAGSLGNQISFVTVALPVGTTDHAEVLCEIRGQTRARKAAGAAAPLQTLAEAADLLPGGARRIVARTAALLRRTGRQGGASAASPEGVESRALALDVDRREAIVRGAPVELTKQEFDLLYLLASRRGIVFSRTALLAKVWHGDTYVTERTVDTVVSRLRRKIERDPQDPELILTAWGVGYKFVDAE